MFSSNTPKALGTCLHPPPDKYSEVMLKGKDPIGV